MMYCNDWEERIALHAGGDLPADEQAAVEQHLAGCSGCQVLWSEMRESLRVLREAHEELLPAASYRAVRARVLAQLGDQPRLWRRWWVSGLAGTAVMAAALALGILPQRKVAPLPAVARALPKAPEVEIAEVRPSPEPPAPKPRSRARVL